VTVVQRLVYVSGAPGSGKSTLAGPLAAELGYALLAKDTIKETLHGVLGPPDLDRSRSRELGAASMELLWALAALSPHVMIEANFRPYSDYERDKLTALGGLQVEVHCSCPPELAMARYSARARHPVHVQTTLTPDEIAQYDRAVGIGTLVTVDTTTPVDVPALAAQLRFLLLSIELGRSWKKRLLYRRFSSAIKIVSKIFSSPGGGCVSREYCRQSEVIAGARRQSLGARSKSRSDFDVGSGPRGGCLGFGFWGWFSPKWGEGAQPDVSGWF